MSDGNESRRSESRYARKLRLKRNGKSWRSHPQWMWWCVSEKPVNQAAVATEPAR